MKKETTPSTEPKPRVIDPAKAALREKYKLESAAIDKAKVSAKTFAHITEKLLPKLTATDTQALAEMLRRATTATPA